jgi:hypothetical protein
MIHYVFNVRYAHKLTMVYSFLEERWFLNHLFVRAPSSLHSAVKSVSDAV